VTKRIQECFNKRLQITYILLLIWTASFPSQGLAELQASNPPANLEIDPLLYIEGLRLGLDQSAEVIAATSNSLRAMAHHGIEQPPLGTVDRSSPVFRHHLAAAARRYWVNKAPRLTPTETQLQDFYQQTQTDYLVPALLSFEHLYFRSDQDWKAIFKQIDKGEATRSAPYPMGSRFTDISQSQVSKRFGEVFASKLFAARGSASWQGPIKSTLGFHLVLIDHPKPEETASLERIRATLLARWQHQKQKAWLALKMEEMQRRLQRP
jgi:hypothetical protein